jgi:2-oxoglutarate ferredoxin oxidoreductase subunit alpha
MTATAFDLTEQLQTPVIVMTDLDLGMNDHITEPLTWDDTREYNRGKVLTSEQLDAIASGSMNGNGRRTSHPGLPGRDGSDETAGEPLQQFRGKFGRYLDIDDDGIPYRTIPGTHLSQGAFTTRGSSRDEYAVYTEDGEAYRRNVDRLARKWDTAKELVPGPEIRLAVSREQEAETRPVGSVPRDAVVYFGTSTYAAEEALELLAADDIHLDAMRPRAFPFGRAFREFIDTHERIFVIEQNRDAQFRSLMMIELGTAAAKLVSVLNYDGMPITADNIYRQISSGLKAAE